MMMDNLDKLFRDNRPEFDHKEPASGHFERFRQKIDQQNQRPAGQNPMHWALKIAALVLVGALLSVLLFTEQQQIQQKIQFKKQGISLSEISPEYAEVENFYQKNYQQKLNEFNQLECEKGQIEKTEILQELRSLERIYKKLQKELLYSRDERIINAMIESYRTRIEMLEQVIERINANC